nr:Cysteine dioxygenase type I domain containing protein [Haemonchus contortus]
MQALIGQMRSIFRDDQVNIEDMEKTLLSYKSDPQDWSRYALFDERNYTRNLVDTGNGKYNMIILCWGPGMCTNIHDHSGSHCFVKILEGQLKETRFAFPQNNVGEPLVKTAESYANVNEVTYMSGQRHTSQVTFWSRYGKLSDNDELPFDRIQTSSKRG